ncbi:hypothetical protein PENSPDRAFT_746368 [Peniophora sp. CONT]|nr:hypothetical protein PENSPDRAFT_746368 [Peniophora sp. CONT]
MAYLSNNPFVDESSSAAARFPSINGYGTPSPPQAAGSQYASWAAPGYSAQSPPPQQQQQFGLGVQPSGYQQPYQQQQVQPTGYGLQSPLGGPQAQQTGFFPQQQQQQFAPQPTGYGSGFGQGQPQIQSQPSYSGYAQQPQQQQYGFQQQSTGYGGGYQQQQPQPYGGNTNLAAFDPYANSSQQQQFQPQQQPGQTQYPSSPGVAPPGQEHPRQYVQAHKVALEQWDAVAWKQATNAFDALASAWEARKRLLDMRIQQLGSTPGAAGGFFGQGGQQGYGGYGGYNPQAQEVERLNGLAKEAENNVGTVYAAKFQMTEVQGSYRHSTDAASKSRVREATNAALTNLPDWPPANF